jgi:predicted ATPase/DNA-binding SARP family transcriptional activator/Tfp pilus assembly protein PilF
LVLKSGTHERREKLAGLFWPDSEESRARRQLRQALWRLRKSIGPDYLHSDRISIGFNPDSNYNLDVDILKQETAWAQATSEVVENISEYSGELLPGFYDEWVLQERSRLASLFDLRMQLLLSRLLEERRWKEVILCSEAWIARGEAPEQAYRALMIAHDHLSDKAGVSSVYQRCVDDLNRELDVLPSEETQSLHERLMREDETLDERPALPRHNLRQPLTTFIGRDRELQKISEYLADASCHLLTLNGPGGIGKTRLALEAARRSIQAFPYGVFFVSLAHTDSEDLLAPTIAEALGLSFFGDEDPRTQLLDFLREKEVLLVLDNLEQIVDGVEFLARILEISPGVKILATTREALNLYGEWRFDVSGMAYPTDIEDQAHDEYSAIRLFLDRARISSPGFSPSERDRYSILRICQLVQGMPLAIELAAVWTQTLTCEEIADAIEINLDMLTTTKHDVPERQRSLRASFNYSWSMLPEEERSVLRRLAVFRGGFRRDAALMVADASLSMLSNLLDKSLLRRSDTGRFEIHPLLGRFIHQELIERDDEQQIVRQSLCEYYAGFFEEHFQKLRSDGQDATLIKVGEEHENIRAALPWFMDHVGVGTLDRVLRVLRVFYDVRGRYEEGERLFRWSAEQLGPAARQTVDLKSEQIPMYARAVASRAWFCHRLHRTGEAISLGNDAVSLAVRLGTQDIEADALDTLGVVALRQGDYQKAKGLFKDSLAIWRELGNHWWQGTELNCLAHAARSLGRLEEASQYADEAISQFKQSGNRWGILSVLSAKGAIARELGELEEAAQCYQESLAMSREIRYQGGIARSSLGLGRVALALGDFNAARQNAHTSLGVYKTIGKMIEISSALTLVGDIHRAQGETHVSEEYFRQALELAIEVGSAPEMLRVMVSLAVLCAKQTKGLLARHLFEYVLGHPALKASDRIHANEFLKGLSSYTKHDGDEPEWDFSGHMGIEEVAEILLDKLA